MNEREIFAAALEQPTEAEREAFLSEVCDDEMRQRIERLLKEQAHLGSFLDHPPLESDPDALAADVLNVMDATLLNEAGSTFDIENEDDNPEQVTAGEQTLKFSQQESDDEIPLGYLEPSSRPDSLGRLAHYEILEVVGQVAFGTVLKAFDEQLHRVVAIKVMSAELAATSPARKRFSREAKASAAIRHENVVSIYNVGETPIPYLVMEYIPGETLQQRLKQTGPLELSEALRLGRQIAYGLAAAHAEQLIHRDVKPGNILLDTSIEDKVKITDFGLARAADDASMTQSGVIAGTPLYMAPEQALGQKLDQRVDLFSFGSVLYQMLGGRPPFRAPNSMAVLKRVVEDTPRPLNEIIPEIPQWMCDIVSRLHEKNPDDRFQTAREVGDLLDACLTDLQAGRLPQVDAPPSVVTIVSAEKVRPNPRRGGRLTMRRAIKVAAMLLILLAGFGFTEGTGLTKISQTIIRLVYGTGTLVIETDDPDLVVSVDGDHVTVSGAGIKQLILTPGDHQVAALRNGVPVQEELVKITRDGEVRLRLSLEPSKAIANASNENSPEKKPTVADYRSVPQGAITEVRRLPRYSPVKEIEFTPDGTYLICKGNSSVPLELWDIEAMSEFPMYTGDCTAFAISPNGNFLATGLYLSSGNYEEGAIQLWDMNTKACLREFVGHREYLRTIEFSPDGRFLLSSSLRDQTARLWDVETAEQLWQIQGVASLTVALSPSGEMALVGDNDLFQLIDVNTGQKLVQSERTPGRFPIHAAAFSPDGRLLVTAHQHEIHFWDPQSGQSTGRILAHEEVILSIRFLPDGRHLITGSEDKTLRIWNVETRTEVARIETQNHFVNIIAVSPDGRSVATGGGQFQFSRERNQFKEDGDNDIRIWQLPESVWPQEPASTTSPNAPFTDADVARIAALPAVEQIEEVRRELIRRNPGFDGHVEHRIDDGAVRTLTFCTDHVTDISPVRALTQLRTLYAEGTPSYSPSAPDHRDMGSLADLSPLHSLKLTRLYAGHNRVADLAPLHGMPLQRLSLAYNREHRLDLTPLADSPLAALVLQQSLVSDLTPLENLQLKELRCGGTQVSDLTPLKGMPLIDLRIDQTRVTDLSPLEGMPLEELWYDDPSTHDDAILREMKTLKSINGKPAAEFWKEVEDGNVGALSPAESDAPLKAPTGLESEK